MAKSENLLNVIKQSKMRLTAQRVAICNYLADTREHPTAQKIYEDLRDGFPTLSLATVYNTLDVLINAGAINMLGSSGDDAVHYDADTEPHINLACLNCHRVIDFPSAYIHQVEQEVQNTSGYHLYGARVLYYGLCPDCQKKIQSSET